MKQKEVTGNLSKINLIYFSPKERTFCQKCQKPVGLMTLSSATNFYQTEVERIYLLIDRGNLHSIQNQREELMICSDSLFAFLKTRNATVKAE